MEAPTPLGQRIFLRGEGLYQQKLFGDESNKEFTTELPKDIYACEAKPEFVQIPSDFNVEEFDMKIPGFEDNYLKLGYFVTGHIKFTKLKLARIQSPTGTLDFRIVVDIGGTEYHNITTRVNPANPPNDTLPKISSGASIYYPISQIVDQYFVPFRVADYGDVPISITDEDNGYPFSLSYRPLFASHSGVEASTINMDDASFNNQKLQYPYMDENNPTIYIPSSIEAFYPKEGLSEFNHAYQPYALRSYLTNAFTHFWGWSVPNSMTTWPHHNLLDDVYNEDYLNLVRLDGVTLWAFFFNQAGNTDTYNDNNNQHFRFPPWGAISEYVDTIHTIDQTYIYLAPKCAIAHPLRISHIDTYQEFISYFNTDNCINLKMGNRPNLAEVLSGDTGEKGHFVNGLQEILARIENNIQKILDAGSPLMQHNDPTNLRVQENPAWSRLLRMFTKEKMYNEDDTLTPSDRYFMLNKDFTLTLDPDINGGKIICRTNTRNLHNYASYYPYLSNTQYDAISLIVIEEVNINLETCICALYQEAKNPIRFNKPGGYFYGPQANELQRSYFNSVTPSYEEAFSNHLSRYSLGSYETNLVNKMSFLTLPNHKRVWNSYLNSLNMIRELVSSNYKVLYSTRPPPIFNFPGYSNDEAFTARFDTRMVSKSQFNTATHDILKLRKNKTGIDHPSLAIEGSNTDQETSTHEKDYHYFWFPIPIKRIAADYYQKYQKSMIPGFNRYIFHDIESKFGLDPLSYHDQFLLLKDHQLHPEVNMEPYGFPIAFPAHPHSEAAETEPVIPYWPPLLTQFQNGQFFTDLTNPGYSPNFAHRLYHSQFRRLVPSPNESGNTIVLPYNAKYLSKYFKDRTYIERSNQYLSNHLYLYCEPGMEEIYRSSPASSKIPIADDYVACSFNCIRADFSEEIRTILAEPHSVTTDIATDPIYSLDSVFYPLGLANYSNYRPFPGVMGRLDDQYQIVYDFRGASYRFLDSEYGFLKTHYSDITIKQSPHKARIVQFHCPELAMAMTAKHYFTNPLEYRTQLLNQNLQMEQFNELSKKDAGTEVFSFFLEQNIGLSNTHRSSDFTSFLFTIKFPEDASTWIQLYTTKFKTLHWWLTDELGRRLIFNNQKPILQLCLKSPQYKQ
jgi:hypothetical protein